MDRQHREIHFTNEKYKGDALLQKSYTADYLTQKKKVNHGEVSHVLCAG